MDIKHRPQVYIVIVNWNGWEDTIECLESLKQLDYPHYSVIVIDNGSSGQSVEEIGKRFPEVLLNQNESNLGFAGGNNVGIRYALERGADYVWLLNNDTVVDREALSTLVEYMNGRPNIGICGSKLIYYHKQDTLQALGGGYFNKWLGTVTTLGNRQPIDRNFDKEEVEDSLDYIIGASMMVSKNFLEVVGLLNEDYFLYFEELDWAMRAKQKFSLGFCPQSIVYHKEGASTGADLQKRSRSKQSDYYQLKNRLKFTCNFFPFFLPCTYLSVVYALFNRIKRGQWDRIPMILKLMFTFNR